MSKNEAPTSGTRLIPISEWHKFHSWPPLGGLRHIRFHCTTNGFEKVFRKIGRRVLIDEKEWFAVIAEKNAEEGNIEGKQAQISGGTA
ncbi:MAG: hypothetical protein Q8L98_08350 [Chlamydiales bacterium]|nr:hypothetical protein [Chlamydiales bacterium]